MALPNASLSLRVLARLLSYPDAELRAHVPDLRQALHDEGAVLPKVVDGKFVVEK